eukprot:c3437_g1_i1.p1 GENE.c3437_g1_i1~~c3437_g1_i1.p1  ORF type:complete len:347 (-),score=108.68 c3437_g1_i1:69-1109(-)
MLKELDFNVKNDARRWNIWRNSTNAVTAAVVAFYFVVSIALVCLNKYVMSYMPYKFPFPVFLTFLQLIVALVLMAILGTLEIKVGVVEFPPFTIRTDTCRRLLPTACVYVGMIVANNICLNYANVAFYQVARSLTILFSIVLTYVLHGTPTSPRAMLACAVVMVGFAIGSWGDGEFSLAGLVAGVVSSLFVALNAISIKHALSIVANNEGVMMLYNTVIASVLLLCVAVLFGEMKHVISFPHYDKPQVWINVLLTGIFGFFINISIILVVKLTSPLTNNIAGTAKACVQTILAVFLFGTQIEWVNGFGLVLCIFGSALYSYIRLLEKHPKQQTHEMTAITSAQADE